MFGQSPTPAPSGEVWLSFEVPPTHPSLHRIRLPDPLPVRSPLFLCSSSGVCVSAAPVRPLCYAPLKKQMQGAAKLRRTARRFLTRQEVKWERKR